MDIRIVRSRKIFSDGKHNAFTGIAASRGATLVTFRSGATHVSFDGVIKVIASTDLSTWSVVAEKRLPGLDLRDPKLVAFRGAARVYCGGRPEEGPRQSLTFSTQDGSEFSEPIPVEGIPEGHWLWWVQPFGERLFGTAYTDDHVGLYGSADGVQWEFLRDFPVPGNEVSFDFDADGSLWALAREDGCGSVPAVCVADPPYASFRSVSRPALRMQGPLIKRLAGGCVLVGRRWDLPGRRNLRTDVFWLEDGRDPCFVRSLPSGGDTSYAGWLDVGEGAAVISYYSSHEHKMDEPHANNAAFARDQAHAEHSTPADIFLADVSYA